MSLRDLRHDEDLKYEEQPYIDFFSSLFLDTTHGFVLMQSCLSLTAVNDCSTGTAPFSGEPSEEIRDCGTKRKPSEGRYSNQISTDSTDGGKNSGEQR